MHHTGSHDLVLVFASYCVAVLAAYTAIFCSTRIYSLDVSFDKERRQLWLIVGALYLGTGVWSMHFLGMIAHELPMNMIMSFNVELTVLSWVPAVLASLLALYVITLPHVKVTGIALASIVMGSGIFSMHYIGMFAMKMSPAIEYNMGWVVISGIIAVLVSAAAMIICRGLRSAPDKYEGWLKFAAALVMGGAISGMHYSGMAAVSYPANAIMDTGNLLKENWLSIPIVIVVCSCLVGLFFIYSDIQERRKRQLMERRATELAQESAFHDSLTGLNNRNMFEKMLIQRLMKKDKTQPAVPFSVLYIELAKGGENAMLNAAKHLQNVFGAELLARYGTHCFTLLLDSVKRDQVTEALMELKREMQHSNIGQRWGWGVSCYPRSASNSRGLIQIARRIREWHAPLSSTPTDTGGSKYRQSLA